MRPDDVVDDEAVEGLAGAAGQAALVEDARDLAGGVLVEELADGGQDVGRGLAGFGPGFGHRQVEGAVLAAGQADVGGDGAAVRVTVTSVISSRVMLLRSRIGVEGSFQTAGRSVTNRAILSCSGGQGGRMLVAGLVVGGLGVVELAQGGVPVGFERVGDEPVGRVDGEVAAAG